MASTEGNSTPLSLREALSYFSRSPLKVHQSEVYDYLNQAEHYTQSFGFQWSKYRDVQIDRLNGTRASWNHLEMFCQGDTSIFTGKTCLEIGAGAGRFTDYLVNLCKTVITIDSSSAIFHNVSLGADNLIACRADLFDIPIKREQIDLVFCRGVIQHTPDPKQALRKLFDYVKPGGIVLFDAYPFKWYTPFVTKYWIRPFTRRMNPEKLASRIEKWMPTLLQFKKRIVSPLFPRDKFGTHLSNQLVPIVDATGSHELSPDLALKWSILDTVDMYAPRYDKPMTFRSVLRELKSLGVKEIQANRSTFCFKGVAP